MVINEPVFDEGDIYWSSNNRKIYDYCESQVKPVAIIV